MRQYAGTCRLAPLRAKWRLSGRMYLRGLPGLSVRTAWKKEARQDDDNEENP
jgi:hypothetical protein